MTLLYSLWDMNIFLMLLLGASLLGILLFKLNKVAFYVYLIPYLAFVLVVSVFILIDFDYHFAKHTDLSGVSLDNLEVGMAISDEDLEKYGEYREHNHLNEIERTYEDLSIHRDSDGVIHYLSTNSEDIMTDKGIRIGDDYEDVKKAYGPNSYLSEEQSMTVLGYRDRKRGITLEFFSIDWEEKGKITSIVITEYRNSK